MKSPFTYLARSSPKPTPTGLEYYVVDKRLVYNDQPMEVGVVCRLEHTAAKVCSALNAQTNLMQAIKLQNHFRDLPGEEVE